MGTKKWSDKNGGKTSKKFQSVAGHISEGEKGESRAVLQPFPPSGGGGEGGAGTPILKMRWAPGDAPVDTPLNDVVDDAHGEVPGYDRGQGLS